MSLDFTLGKYAQLCNAIKHLACPVMTISQFLKAGQPQEFVIVLRHDVDRALPRAIDMADLEAAYGIRATYYLRKTRTVFQETEIKYLHQLGHEVGYHYEVLSKARGNREQALNIFVNELAQFRRIVPVETISMHGSPLLPWNNLDLWRTNDFRDYDLLGEAYLSIDYTNLYYFTDTGRSWCAGRYNIRDRTDSQHPPQEICTTDDLHLFLTGLPERPVIINAHPNRWTRNWLAWLFSAASDWAINQIKWGLSLTR